MHILSHSDLPAYVAESPAIPVDKDRSEVRLYATMLTGIVVWSLVKPAFYILTADTPLARVAGMIAPPWVIALAFTLAAVALLPHFVSLVFLPKRLGCKLPRKMAAGAMWAAAALWAYIATRAWPLDMGSIPLTYWLSAFGYLLVAGAYGYSLNAQQALEKLANEIESKTR